MHSSATHAIRSIRTLGLCVLGAAALCVGCSSGKLLDPNDPREREVAPEMLSANLHSISDSLIDRRLRKEINNAQYRELIAQAAGELVKELRLSSVDPSEAWQYGEILRTARQWQGAEELLTIAVEHAAKVKNDDRWVNDTLRLAQAQAHLDKAELAIKTANKVMTAEPTASAPILLAVLYEILPAARGRGQDAALAELLHSAIQKHLRTSVDSATVPGRDFMAARSHHVSAAYMNLADLYKAVGEKQKADDAVNKAKWAATDFPSFLKAELAKDPLI